MPSSNDRYVTFTYRLDRELAERVTATGGSAGISNRTQALNFFVRKGLKAYEDEERARGVGDDFRVTSRPRRERSSR